MSRNNDYCTAYATQRDACLSYEACCYCNATAVCVHGSVGQGRRVCADDGELWLCAPDDDWRVAVAVVAAILGAIALTITLLCVIRRRRQAKA